MRITPRIAIILLALVATAPCAAQVPASPAIPKLTYRPAPGADLTSTRVNVTSRGGTNGKLPVLSVVAPDHPGTTLSDQPQLYWYISDATDLSIEVALIEEGTDNHLYEFSKKGFDAGFHCLDLAKEEVHLDANKRYQLVVDLVVNPKNRANDLVTSGFVKRVKPSDELARNLAGTQGLERAAKLLSSGIWYDGMADLMKEIDAGKNDAQLVAERDALLKQVGLSAIVSASPSAGTQTRPK